MKKIFTQMKPDNYKKKQKQLTKYKKYIALNNITHIITHVVTNLILYNLHLKKHSSFRQRFHIVLHLTGVFPGNAG